MEVPQKLIWSNNSTSRYISKNENVYLKRYTHPIFIAALYNSQDMEAIRVTINRWMNKEDVVYSLYIYIHIYIYITHTHAHWNTAESSQPIKG